MTALHPLPLRGAHQHAPTLTVLMACHNRAPVTLRSLRGLAAQRGVGASVSVVLVDDGSSDGTAQAVAAEFPAVRVVPGDGSLFWSGGMALAQQHALAGAGPDFLLWLNDDVELAADALSVLLECNAQAPGSVVVGATADPVGGQVTYSGFRRLSRIRPKKLVCVPPAGRPLELDTFNGNVVLVPRIAYAAVGAVEAAFAHGLGDLDYGFRVRRAGLRCVLAGTVVGTCPRNLPGGSWEDPDLPLAERFRRLLAPKGLPVRSQALFYRRHGTRLWPAQLAALYLKVVLRIVLSTGRARRMQA